MPSTPTLIAQGPVRFGQGVVIQGDVTLTCESEAPVTISNVTYTTGAHTITAPDEATTAANGAVPQPSLA